MKKHIGLWITAIIIFCLGISLTISGVAGGATQIIKNSDGFIEKIGNVLERAKELPKQPAENTDLSDNSELSDDTEMITTSESTKDNNRTADTNNSLSTEKIYKLNVNLEGYAISLKPTAQNEIQVKPKYTNGSDHSNISVTTENGVMTVEGINNGNKYKNQVVEIFIPNVITPEVSIETTDSAISAEELSLNSLTCVTENAAISVEDVRCDTSVSLTTANALISVEEVYADNVSINSSAGVITFDSLHFNALDVTNSTGAVNGELEARSLYTVTVNSNGKTKTTGTGSKTVNITNDTGIVSLEYDD